jgi:hypothetical protein
MGMALWLHTLNGRNIEGTQNDCTWMYRLAEELDLQCQVQGVLALSSFFDYTDLQANMGEEDEEPEPAVDPETGWSYGIDDMQWFEAASGLQTLQSLDEHLRGTPSISGLPDDRRDELFEELTDCIRQLQGPAELGQKFHLALIM